jgi:ATP-dependent DNA helicase RecG
MTQQQPPRKGMAVGHAVASGQGPASVPITQVKGVGAALAVRLAKLHIHSLQDLLFHLPLRYLDRTQLTPMGDLQVNTSVVIQGWVNSCQVQQGRRRSLVCVIEDETGQAVLRFYHFTAQQIARLAPGTPLRCYGDPRLGVTGLEFYHPELEFLQHLDDMPDLAQTLTPIYPLTEGISQSRMRQIAAAGLELMAVYPPAEWLPEALMLPASGVTLAQALAYVHSPPLDAPVHLLTEGRHPYQQRLVFEELLAHNLAVQRSRRLAQAQVAPPLAPQSALQQQLLAQLPFALTQAQSRVIQEIGQDMAQAKPMLRMVQGDVGSGKTLVAAAAAANALAAGWQVALVAPTEILAEQHRANFSRWFEPLGIAVGWLVGKLSAGQKRHALEAIAQGHSQLVVGTHALFEEAVQFAQLGLVVIDEQHRFGVQQRLSLRHKSAAGLFPHQLVMTATPIPRTLAMTTYCDLDLSVIDALPPGRTPVTTVLISQTKRAEVVERVRLQCQSGRQAYWVCTLVEDSETLAAAAAEATAVSLQASLPELRVGLVHGRQKARDKEAVMAAFKAGELQLLVATTVIEVGVDVPNASVMIIENPERLGLAQLHQLRGRVGRGSAASHCVLLYGTPLSRQGRERLDVLRASQDGFVIAEKDLALRGPGELLGTRQTGGLQFRLADLQRDSALLEPVLACAEHLHRQYPERIEPLVERWFGQQQGYVNA